MGRVLLAYIPTPEYLLIVFSFLIAGFLVEKLLTRLVYGHRSRSMHLTDPTRVANSLKLDDYYLLMGHTYQFRKELKELGGRWEQELKAWVLKGGHLKIFLLSHAGEIKKALFREGNKVFIYVD